MLHVGAVPRQEHVQTQHSILQLHSCFSLHSELRVTAFPNTSQPVFDFHSPHICLLLQTCDTGKIPEDKGFYAKILFLLRKKEANHRFVHL